MIPVIVAETYLSWLPAFSSMSLVVIAAICVVLWLGLRIFWGASHLQGRFGLLVLRCCTLGLITIILFGPTIVEEHSSEISRPSLLYVLDGSQSMRLGQSNTRWEASLQFIQDAEATAGPQESQFSQAFRFGHQLQPLWLEPDTRSAGRSSGLLLPTADASEQRPDGIPGPEASDSRLADALRQLLPQVNSASTSGVVLLSDGRVRDTDSVEQLAMMFGKSKVPLHVVPVGEVTGTGDMAVVSLVVPRSVRKFTENELQVFLRSFGFTGQRTTVRVRKRNQASQPQSATLAEIPVTLSGGAQSVSLNFRMDETPEDLVIEVEPIEGELTTRNNSIETRVEINRTKVRVLYVEGESGQSLSPFSEFSSVFGLSRNNSRNDLSVRDALEADKEIECRVLVSIAGRAPQLVSEESAPSNSRGFPASRAELFAYDCVIFNNVGPNVLEEQQVQWLTQWVEGRGGGLIVSGSEALQQEFWQDSPLAPLLPLSIESASPQQPRAVELEVTERQHPIWRLQLEERLNDDLLEELPPLQMADLNFVPKPTAEVLATRRDNGDAVLLAHRAGRGRVIATSAELGGQSLRRLAETWGSQPERVASKFWRNLVYWATEGSSTGRRRLVAQCDKQFYRPGETLKVTATAFDETARQTNNYEIWAMFEPTSLDEMSLYSPILWPDDIPRESGEAGPRIVWGEELPLTSSESSNDYELDLSLSETENSADSGFRIELTAYLESESNTMFSHGTQVDSTSLAVRILNDPFEQQNPLPNHELLRRLADVSGGQVLESPSQLAEVLRNRNEIRGAPSRDLSPAWSRWWMWLSLLGLLTCEWAWRRVTGLA